MTATLTSPPTYQVNGTPQDTWITYIPVRTGIALGVNATVNRDGFAFSRGLRHAIGNPERVALLYNPTTHQLALRPGTASDPYSAKANGSISRAAIERAFKITLPLGKYAVEIRDDMAIVTIPR